MVKSKISSYTDLLDIRLKAFKRNVTLAGAVFFISLFAFFILGMLDLLDNQREVFLIGFLLVFVGLAYITMLIRYEIVKNASELSRILSENEERA